MSQTSNVEKETSGRLDTEKISQDSNPSTFSRGGSDMAPKCQCVYIRTFGCQMNVRDSEIVAGLLQENGYQLVNTPKEADITLFNTCTVREHAAHRAVSALGKLSSKKKKGQMFGLIGCLAQDKKEALFKSVKNLDFVCGPSEIYNIPSILKEISIYTGKGRGKEKIVSVSSDRGSRPLEYINPQYRESKKHSYVNISYGCDNFCSYCVVPYVRGKEVSRPVLDIVKEVKSLVKQGITEVTLLGQNVNSYRVRFRWTMDEGRWTRDEGRGTMDEGRDREKVDFVRLLKIINEIEGLKKISFATSHPKDASVELFKAMVELDKVEKKLHLPIQSGSNKILKLMNRGYTREDYLRLVRQYRKIVDGQIGTDIIVGFPAETEEDFRKTKDILERVRFDYAYIFKYSPRPGTAAAELDDDVQLKEKERRHRALLELQRFISREKACLGLRGKD